ncbi:MAG: hypothetical protein AAF492_18070, partial [Verrucomicrobiota bacterium]
LSLTAGSLFAASPITEPASFIAPGEHGDDPGIGFDSMEGRATHRWARTVIVSGWSRPTATWHGPVRAG